MTEVIKHQASPKGILFTESSKKHFLAGLAKNQTAKGLRFSLKKTGCSGLSYVVDYVEEAKENDLVFNFEGNFLLYVDKASWPLLKGTTVDFIKEGLNRKLTFSNPNQTGQCGCGESFTVD